MATVALTGTATSALTKLEVITGGKTLIATITGDTWVPATGTPTYSTGSTKGTTAADGAGGGGGRTGNGDLTCTFPSGYTPTAGHFALMILYNDQGSGTTPSTWSAVTGQPFGAGTEKLNIFYKVLAGGEGSPVSTISGSGTNISHVANIAIYTGVGSIGAIGSPSNSTGTPMTAAAITTTANNSIVCACSGRGDNEDSGSQTFNGSSTGVNERLDGGTASGSDSQVSMADITIATSGSSSGAASSTTSATDPWVCVQIELKPSTAFDSARAAIISGLDSAQSEAAGWDAKVKPNIPVGNVVRTSDTVITVTLQAQADYVITAQETITWTLPATATALGQAVVASPTFTADPGKVIVTTAGAFTLTGVASGLTAQRSLTATVGPLDLTGTTTNLNRGYVLGSTVGTHSLTGTTTGLTAQRLLTSETGTFALTGVAADLTYTPAGSTYNLDVDAGSFTFTGNTTGLVAARLLSPSVAAFALTGVDADLSWYAPTVIYKVGRLRGLHL
jgi:hypothetical protein